MFSASVMSAMLLIQLRSAPAEKCLPLPLISSTRTAGEDSACAMADSISAMVFASNALLACGRFRARVATPLGATENSIERNMTGFLKSLHPEDAEACFFNGRIHGNAECHAQNIPGLQRVNHTVIPQACAGIVRMTLLFVGVDNRLLEVALFVGAPGLAAAFEVVALDLGEYTGSLLPTHYGNAGIRPHEHEAGIVGATAHAIVASTKTSAEYQGQLGHFGSGHGGYHFGAIFGYALIFVFPAHHEAGD